MAVKSVPFTKDQIENIIATHPTAFHIYDEKAIRENARKLKELFSWAPGFREYFAVKATPNPYIMKILGAEDFGTDCSSLTELLLSEKINILGEDIMFSYLVQKYGGINTFVPPHPETDKSVWSTSFDYSINVGNDENSSFKIGTHYGERDRICAYCIDNGWETVNKIKK